MAIFNDMIITNGGKIQYAKAIAGKTLTFTSVKFGDGAPASGTDPQSLTDLVSSKITGAIKSIDTTTREGVAELKVELSNASLTEPIGIREIGVFCKDADTNESVLYGYAYSPTDIDVIPSNTYGTVTWKMSVLLEISSVTATGTTSQQSSFIDFTPVLTPTATDATTFISNVSASGKYVNKNGLVTAFYTITGTLLNTAQATAKLTSLALSLPEAAVRDAVVKGNMLVTAADSNVYLVGVEGVISAANDNIDIQYIGTIDGTFKLELIAEYIA